jgi:hypothetical protein
MIPKYINREHILEAIKRIDTDGVPETHNSTKFDLLFENRRYPPKYVISISHLLLVGKMLPVKDFSGGDEANNFLASLGFQIVSKEEGEVASARKENRVTETDGMNLFLAAATKENLEKSILNKVSFETAEKFLEAPELKSLESALGGRKGFNCWAMTGDRSKMYESMEVGDLVFLTMKETGAFNFVGSVLCKFESIEFGKGLWSYSGKNPWKYIYVLANLVKTNTPKKEFVTSFGYKPKDPIQRPRRIKEENLEIAISKFGSIENLLKHFGINLVSLNEIETDLENNLRQGAGFGNPELNKKVETVAILKVTKEYEETGWSVKSVEADKCGYDLLCTKDLLKEHVEVKGISGGIASFIITAGEVKQARNNPNFRICIVTSALKKNPQLTCYSGQEFIEQFSLSPLAFKASLNQ